MDVSDILEHHGIKGQRWGIRHKPNPETGRVSTDFKVADPLRKRPVSSLTNKQLKIANERANLEQNFRRLNPTKKELNRRRTKAILASAGLGSIAAVMNNKHAQEAISRGITYLREKSIKEGVKTIGRTVG